MRYCPICGVEMKDAADLLDPTGLDHQEFPGFFWCPACGTFIDSNWRNGDTVYLPRGKQVEIPADRLAILDS